MSRLDYSAHQLLGYERFHGTVAEIEDAIQIIEGLNGHDETQHYFEDLVYVCVMRYIAEKRPDAETASTLCKMALHIQDLDFNREYVERY